MKYNYCPKCDKAYVKSRLEGEVCIYCGSGCETADVRKNGMYYLGYGIMLAAAACAYAWRVLPVLYPDLFLGAGIGLLIVSVALFIKAGGKMAMAARDMVLGERGE